MNDFTQWTEEEREKTFSERLNTELMVSRETLNFINIETDIPSADNQNWFEIPPIIFDRKHLAEIIFFAPDNDKGRWIRTLVRTYMEGGKVLFKQHDAMNFIAKIEFSDK